MAAHRYWRITMVATISGALELSDLTLYTNGVLHTTAITFTVPPTTGSSFPGLVTWADCTQSGFAIVLDATTPVDSVGLRLGAGDSASTFLKGFTLQYSDDGAFWTQSVTVLSATYPGALALTAVPVAASFVVVPTTWNPADKGSGCTLSNGNLTATGPQTQGSARTIASVSTGKFYWEVVSTDVRLPIVGVANANASLGIYPGYDAHGWSYYGLTALKIHDGSEVTYGSVWSSQVDVIGLALDADMGEIEVYRNGASMGVMFTGMTGPFFAMTGGDTNGGGPSSCTANFGATPFAYPVPDGYYAGLGLLTSDLDPNLASVVLQLNGNTLTDASVAAHVVTALGNTHTSADHMMFGPKSIYFDGVGDSLTVPSFTVAGVSEDFTMEMWVYPTALSGYRQLFYNQASFLQLVLNAGKVMQYGNGYTAESPSGVVTGVWQHVAMSRESGVIRVFLNGVPGATQTSNAAVLLTDIGSYNNSTGEFFEGYMEQIRVTKGVCRYNSTFTPTNFYLAGSGVIAESGDALSPVTDAEVTYGFLHGEGYLDPLTVHGREFGYVVLDAENGGDGAISGTVKEKNSPTDTPLGRRVILMEDSSRLVIRATWSDPVTGAYSFTGIKKGPRYSVISFDHLHNYRAVIADNQEAL